MTNIVHKASQMRHGQSPFSYSTFAWYDAFCYSENWLHKGQVVAAMRDMVNKDSQNLISNSFLLDDDLR